MGFEGGAPSTGAGTTVKLHELIHDESVSPSATTTSATYETLASSASTAFSGNDMLVIFSGTAFSTNASTNGEFAIQIDSGADVRITPIFFSNANVHRTLMSTDIITPTAGNHVINLRWRRTAGTGTLTMDSNDQIHLDAVEL